MNHRNFEAIIFDLGGVILNIDYQRTAQAFKNLGLADFDELYSQAEQTELFDQFETGKISAFHFINRILDKLPKGSNANQVVHAWNAMLLDFPKERIDLLKQLRQELPVFLLSNTNELHITHFERLYHEQIGSPDFHDLFNKIYYSSEVGLRKPNREIFELVIEENKLNPSKTLFIDDSIQHIEGAQKIHLETHHLQKGTDIQSLFS